LKQLYFVRHGQTEWNAIRRMQGQWNSDLSELGRTQADANGRLLANLDIDAIFASPLDRTRQTAEIITQHVALPIAYDDRIKEWDCGDWSGHLYDEVKAKWAQEWAALAADRFNYRGPNCENYPDMIARATPFLEELKALPTRNIAIVSHGMIGRVMVSVLAGHNEIQMLSYGQDNDVIYRVSIEGESLAISHYVAGDGPHEGLT
jgi:broad specificity phosphatase PhoE